MNAFPLTKEQFNDLRDKKAIEADALFPIMDYDFCKYVWENSPLIQHLINEVEKLEGVQ